jgi:hypothetical protein
MSTLGIDPGNKESAFALIDADYRPLAVGKILNDELLARLNSPVWHLGMGIRHTMIEQIGHYGTGMPAGREVFDTCRWIGRFEQVLTQQGLPPDLTLRPTIKAHLCGSAKAKDGNVAQALADRFAPGEPRRGKGTKAEPGWFYGFAADIWAAYSVAVYAQDMRLGLT